MQASELETSLSDYADDPPASVARSLCGGPLWVADEVLRVVEPAGVLAGMAFAAATRAARVARAGLLESLDWDRRARALKGRHATPPGQKALSGPGAPHLEPVVSTDAISDE